MKTPTTQPKYGNSLFGPGNSNKNKPIHTTVQTNNHPTTQQKKVFNPYKKPPHIVTVTQSPTNSLSNVSVSSRNRTPTTYRSPVNRGTSNLDNTNCKDSPIKSKSASSFRRVSPPTRPYSRNNMRQDRPTNPKNVSPNRVQPSPIPYRQQGGRVHNPYTNKNEHYQAPIEPIQQYKNDESELAVFRFDLSQMSTSSLDSDSIRRRNSEESFERSLAKMPLPEKVTKLDMTREKYKNTDVGVSHAQYVDKDSCSNVMV